MISVILFGLIIIVTILVYLLIVFKCDKKKKILQTVERYKDDKGHFRSGEDAAYGAHVAQVLFRSENGPFCSGTILDPFNILTAGHCVDTMKKQKFVSIHVGTNSRNHEGTTHFVEKAIIHECYHAFNDDQIVFDSALIHVTEKIEFNEEVQPMQLSDRKNYKEGLYTIIRSRPRYDTETSNLQKINVPLYKNCSDIYSQVREKVHICTLCENRIGVFRGDSGGPLMFNNEQIGIISYGGYTAGDKKYVDVHTWVKPIRRWIEQNKKKPAIS